MTSRSCFYLVFFALLLPCRIFAGEISLVENGKSAYTIIIPDEPLAAENKAAGVLQRYVQQVCGVLLPVKKESAAAKTPGIFIGKTEAGSAFYTGRVQHDGYVFVTARQQIFIAGLRGKGSVYGVYDFLERYFGCRKYDAGAPVFQHLDTVSVPDELNEVHNPAFVYRESYYPPSADPEYLEWHKLQQFTDLWGIWGHSFFRLVPPDEYFKAHPEYFSLVNGKRVPRQLCLSNDAVFSLVKTAVQKAIARNPDALYWSLSQMDGGGYCTCAHCAAADAEEGGPQGSLIRFVNRVSRAFPEQQFTTLAYGYSAHPPKKTRPEKNLIILLSDIDAYRQKPLAEEASAAAFRSQLSGWQALTDQLFIWDYTTQFTHYLTPFPDFDTFKPNLNYFRAHAVKGVFMQGSGETYGDMSELNSYLQAKLLWDPQADVQALMQDFLGGYYGKAAPAVRAYLDEMQQAIALKSARLDIYGNPANDLASYLDPGFLNRQAKAFFTLKNSAPAQKDRLERILLSLQYVAFQQAKKTGTHVILGGENSAVPKAEYLAAVADFSTTCTRNGVLELAEGGQTPDAYLAEWKAILARPDVKNLALGAPVALEFPFSEDYPANGAKTLTDGLFGGTDYSTNWLYFYGTDLGATVDLGGLRSINGLRLNFLHDPQHYIFAPEKLRIECSADGKTYTPLQSDSFAAAQQDDKLSIRTVSAEKKMQVRFIRVHAKCLGELPSWRASGTKKPALCCDEILVF